MRLRSLNGMQTSICISLFSQWNEIPRKENNGRPSVFHTRCVMLMCNIMICLRAHTHGECWARTRYCIYANLNGRVYGIEDSGLNHLAKMSSLPERHPPDAALSSTSPSKCSFRSLLIVIIGIARLIVIVPPFSSVVLIRLLRLLQFHIFYLMIISNKYVFNGFSAFQCRKS